MAARSSKSPPTTATGSTSLDGDAANRVDRLPLQQLTQAQLEILSAVTATPQRSRVIAQRAGYVEQTARKYLPMLRKWGYVERGPRGYYRETE